jgi:hypothetical protein
MEVPMLMFPKWLQFPVENHQTPENALFYGVGEASALEERVMAD